MMNNHLLTSNIFHAPFRRPLFSRFSLAVKNWRSRRIAIRQLRAMPEALLRDIGIERYQIENLVMRGIPQAKILPLRNASRHTECAVRADKKAA